MIDKTELVSNFINENLFELPMIINDKITEKSEKYTKRDEFNILKRYIDNFINNKNISNRFIVLPGIRGVGKTTLLYQIYEYLLKEVNIPFNQILYFSCEELTQLIDCNIHELTKIYLKNYHNTSIRLLDKKVFLLIDESQYDKQWALSGKIIFDKTDNVFMMFTGSSALELEYNADSARRLCKKDIHPLDYSHHLRLKYGLDLNNSKDLLINLLFTGNIDEALTKEFQINNLLINTFNYKGNDWDNFLLYGGFPVYFNENDTRVIRDKIVDMINKVVYTDMINIKNVTKQNQIYAYRILNYLSQADSSEVSYNKLSTYLNTSSSNISNILGILEDTHLIFHLEAYGSSSKRTRRSWKYYFATSSLKNVLNSKSGNVSVDKSKYEGVLIENLIASKLYELSDYNFNFSLYYDSNKNKNVDFIIKQEFKNPIPIEVGRGKKDKKQILEAIHTYNADYGIIISNTTSKIEKENNIIYIPVKTFALL